MKSLLNAKIVNFLSISIIFFLFGNVSSQSIPCTNSYGNRKYNGTCQQIDQCIGAALIGNCQNSICCIPDTSQPNLNDKIITKNIFLKVAGNTSRNSALYGFFVQSMQQAQINNQNKAAAYFSTLLGESNFFRDLESKINDPDINADLGNNATGHGLLFRGRGAILVRGRTNYELANSRLKFGEYKDLNATRYSY